MFLSKQVPPGQQSLADRTMLKIIDVLGVYYNSGKAYGNSVLHATLSWREEALVRG